MGAISIGSFIKDGASLPLSSSLGMWGPLELIAFGGQAYLAYINGFGNSSATNSSLDSSSLYNDSIDFNSSQVKTSNSNSSTSHS